MTTLTPEQRLRGYQWALKLLSHAYNNNVDLWLIMETYCYVNVSNRIGLHAEMFPELWERHRLLDLQSNDVGYLMRVMLLLECIEEVKTLIK